MVFFSGENTFNFLKPDLLIFFNLSRIAIYSGGKDQEIMKSSDEQSR